jgi:hypothetical protein
MSNRVKVSLANKSVAFAGVLTFDGEVLEALGFAEIVPRRLPIELIDEVELSNRELNVFSNPEKGDSYGIQLAIKPSDDEQVALQELAASIQQAIDAKAEG